ncbi:MAG: S46 family peptidase [Terricaulis sp.]
MRLLARAFTALCFGIFAFSSTPAAFSAEGMWTFDNFPAERMREELGWAPDQAWLDRVMRGTARMPGCSASNVSAQGLVMTNHHCVIGCVQSLSTADANYLDTGFMARAREEERRCPGMFVQVLTQIADVTDRINAAADGVPPEGFAHARDAEVAQLQGACTSGNQRCEVVTLYQGGRYALYTYRRYDDVRLVFAPEHQAAAFGGDPDNFNFPRYDADFSFVRLYENGAPAATPGHLSMRFTPLTENEIVLIAGNPGATQRLKTAAELTFERDVDLPWRVTTLTALRSKLHAYAGQGPNQARVASNTIQSVENALKASIGRRDALASTEGFARITAREADLQTRVHRDRAATREIGSAWQDVAAAELAYRRIFYRFQYLELRAGERSDLFSWARDIVRAAAERDKPDAQRLSRYADSRLPAIQQSVLADRPVHADFEELVLTDWLANLKTYVGPTTQRTVLGAETPAALAHRLAQSRLADPTYRQQLWSGGAAAVAASDDPMIVFVRAWDADARALRERYLEDVEGPVERAQEKIAQARFRAFGQTQYPDATFSPRLSYGRVEGWTEPGGQVVGPFTRIGGLYARATVAPPYDLVTSWTAARGRLDPNTVFDIATSTDVTGGNSGSPLLDKDGNVVGAVFDGNIHSLGGEFYYDGALNRTVTVASTAIEASLRDVYGMNALLAELRGG